MKPTMYIKLRISTDTSWNQRFTEEEIMEDLLNNRINIHNSLLIRKKDGAVMGEILKYEKDNHNN